MQDDTITLRRQRGYAACLHEGYHQLTHRFNLVSKFTWPILAIGALANFVIGFAKGTTMLSDPYILATYLSNLLVIIYLAAATAVLLRKIDEVGYIPSVTLRVLGRSVIQRSIPSFIIALIATIILALSILAVATVGEAPQPTPILYDYLQPLIPILALLLMAPLAAWGTHLMLADTPLSPLTSHLSPSNPLKLLSGHFLAVLIVALLIALSCLAIAAIPYTLCLIVAEHASLSLLMGDPVTLPAYFPLLMALAQTIAALALYIAYLLIAFPLAFQWGSTMADKE